MKNITKDKITGSAALLFGLSLLWYFIPNWVVMNSAALNHTSPDTFPKFVAIALVLLGAFLLAQAFYREHQNRLANISEEAESENTGEKPALTRKKLKEFMLSETYCVVVTALAILLFDFLFTRVGYIVTGCVCSLLLLVAFRSKKWYHYVIAIAFTVLLYFVFSKILLVKMP